MATNILTVKELHDRTGEAMREGMGDARIFVYAGPEGIKVQAESTIDTDKQGGRFRILISSSVAIPQAGGPAI